jgi:hypothetical protein
MRPSRNFGLPVYRKPEGAGDRSLGTGTRTFVSEGESKYQPVKNYNN